MKLRIPALVLVLTVLLWGGAAAEDWIPETIESPLVVVPEWNEPDTPLLVMARADGLIYMEDIDAPLRDFLQQRARCVFDSIRPSLLMQRVAWVTEVDLSEYEGTMTDERWFLMFDDLTKIVLPSATFDNLDVIGGFPHLEELSLVNCGFFDLTPLAECSGLTTLSIGWDDDYTGEAGAFDLTPLMKLEDLTSLSLYGNGIESLNAFTSAAMKRIHTLVLSDTAIEDFSLLSKFTKLNTLTLDLLHSTGAAAAMNACPNTLKNLTLRRLILNPDTDAAVKRFKSLTSYTISDCDASDDLFYENLNAATELTLENVSLPSGIMVGEVYADKTTLVLRGVPEAMMIFLLDDSSAKLSDLTIDIETLTDDLNDALRQKTALNTLTVGLAGDTDLAGDMWKRVTGINTVTIDSAGKTLSSTDFLSELPRVYTLTLQGVNVEDTAGLATLEYVTTLTIVGCRISDWSFLQNMKRVTTLKIYASALTDDALAYVAGMSALEDLRLDGNDLTDISALTASATIRKLDILDNPIADYTPLLQMPNLSTVYSGQKGIITSYSILARSVYIDDIDYEKIEQEAFGNP
jgi:Leucine-rich repeat (LRR) protein